MKNQNIILGGVLLAVGVGAYLFLSKKEVADSLSGIIPESETEPNTKTVAENISTAIETMTTNSSTGGKSTIADIPVDTPIISDTVNKEAEAKTLAEAKAISATIAEMRRKQSGYKKASSVRNIQTVIDGDIAKLLALGYTPLSDGGVQKV